MKQELQSAESQVTTRRENNPSALFFSVVAKQFEAATQAVGGSLNHDYHIAGHDIRLQFAGPALIPKLTPALAHLATAPTASPALTICIWDSASTCTRMPAPPWSWDVRATRGDIMGYNDEQIRTAVNGGALSMIDFSLQTSLFWIRDASQVPYYETGAPLLRILHWWLGEQGNQLVHAAALGTPTGGVLLVGPGGSGKSTTALSCLKSSLLYASDDYCLVANEPAPHAYSVYNTAKVDRQTLVRFPHLMTAVGNPDQLHQEKALLFLWRHFPETIMGSFPIRAIILPQVASHTETAISPASPLEGLRALAPSTMRQLAGAGQVAWQAMTSLVKRVPCYHLHLSSDPTQLPPVITRVIERHA